ncbi:MAG: hypothetical protein NWE75_00020 [Candidatus Bathyarchaeota archaeon]|nr:hypothetical protein [Candidatus Bathyarchaeota archaeon]
MGLPELSIDPTEYLLGRPEPWVQYNARIKLLGRDPGDPELDLVKQRLLRRDEISEIVAQCKGWPGAPLTRHNDARHLIHKISFLADLGLGISDPGIQEIVEKILQNRSENGAIQSNILIPEHFGGTGKPRLDWMLCDAPTLLYSLLCFGLEGGPVGRAVDHLVSTVDDNGWRCRSSIPGMRGPGRKGDHCPYANLISLKALSLVPDLVESEACKAGVEAQLSHWENRSGRRIYMFGIGGTFAKLKYPNIWYDILHVVEVLSRFPYALEDDRFRELLGVVYDKQRGDGSFAAESVYRAWKGWSFGQKKESSPWLTCRIAMIDSRITGS